MDDLGVPLFLETPMWILSIGIMLRQFHWDSRIWAIHIFLTGPTSKQHGCRQLSAVALPLMMNIKLWTWSPPWNGCYPAFTSELFMVNGCWSMLFPRSSIQSGSTKIVYFDGSTWCGSNSWVIETAGRGPLALRSVLFWFLEIFPCESCLISIPRILDVGVVPAQFSTCLRLRAVTCWVWFLQSAVVWSLTKPLQVHFSEEPLWRLPST